MLTDYYLEIEEIVFERGIRSFSQLLGHLPPNLRILKLPTMNYPRMDSFRPMDHLPPSLHTLIINTCKQFCYPLDNLPHSLQVLSLRDYCFPLDHLPPNLKSLELRMYLLHSLTLSLPSYLISLSFFIVITILLMCFAACMILIIFHWITFLHHYGNYYLMLATILFVLTIFLQISKNSIYNIILTTSITFLPL